MPATDTFRLVIQSEARGDAELKRMELSINRLADAVEKGQRRSASSYEDSQKRSSAAMAKVAADNDSFAQRVQAASIRTTKAITEVTATVVGMKLAFEGAAASAVTLASNQQVVSRVIDGYRALRLATSAAAGSGALAFTAVSIGAVVAAEKIAQISNNYGKLIEQNALLTASNKQTFGSVQTFGTASRVTGRDLSAFSAFDPDKVRDYITELEKIQDPVDRAKRATELFGKDAATAYELLGTSIKDRIRDAQELTQQLDAPTRASIQRLRDDFKAFENFRPFDDAVDSLRLLREEAKQGITIRFSAALDFVRGLGNRLGPAGDAGGLDGAIAVDSGERPGLGIPSYDDFRRMAREVIGSSARFNAEGTAPNSALLPKSPNTGSLSLGRSFRSGAAGSEDSLLAAISDISQQRTKLRNILSTPGIGDADFKDINGRLLGLASQEASLQERLKNLREAGKPFVVKESDLRGTDYQPGPQFARRGKDGFIIPEGTTGSFAVTEADRRKFEAGAYNPGNATFDAERRQQQQEKERNVAFARSEAQFQERKIELLTGPGGELDAINKIADLRLAALQQEIDLGAEILDSNERRFQIEEDRELRLLEYQKRRRDQARELASDFVGAIQSGRPQDFFRQQGGRLLNQIGTNALTGTFQRIQGSLGTFGASTGLGGLLKGTLLDPSNAAPIDKNTLATDRNTAALERVTTGASASGVGGFSTPASAGAALPAMLQGYSASFSSPTGKIAQIGAGLASVVAPGGLFAGLRSGSISQGNGRATTTQGLGIDSTAARAANVTGSIATLGAGALTAFRGFQQGGAAGITQGITATLGTAALIPGPQQPFIAAAAATAALVGMLLPDPKKARDRQINTLLNDSLYTEPSSMAFNLDRGGRSLDTDKLGNMRPIQVNVSALDAQSLMDRRLDIADAIRQSIYDGHGIVRAIQEGSGIAA